MIVKFKPLKSDDMIPGILTGQGNSIRFTASGKVEFSFNMSNCEFQLCGPDDDHCLCISGFAALPDGLATVPHTHSELAMTRDVSMFVPTPDGFVQEASFLGLPPGDVPREIKVTSGGIEIFFNFHHTDRGAEDVYGWKYRERNGSRILTVVNT